MIPRFQILTFFAGPSCTAPSLFVGAILVALYGSPMLVARVFATSSAAQSESCVYRRFEPVNTAFRTQPRQAGEDHRGSRDQHAISNTPERTPGERFGEAPAAGAET